MNKFFTFLLFLLFSQNSFAQPQPLPEERAVQLSVTTQISPPQINLEWKIDNGATKYIVHRKGLTDTDWGTALDTLPGTATSYVDANVQVGVGYEYAFFKEDFSYYKKTVCVPAGTPVEFTINDANGVGLCCSFGNGFYELKNCNNTVAYGDDFGATESTNFTVCNDSSGCSEIYITIKPSLYDNSTSWSLKDIVTGQLIDSDGGPGIFLRPRPEFGFIYAGIELPPIEDRGRILLVVEDDLVTPLATELTELEMDFIKDGWRVSTINVDRNDPIANVHAAIQNVYNANADLKSVLLLGHVPIVYSGSIFPDTHTENEGAYPADVFYGEMDGIWTDSIVNTTAPFLSIYHNVPGDGRFDQGVPPSGVVELQVGRVDFFDMPAFGQTEVQLVQQYLNKNHQFKTRQINPTRRALMDDNLIHVNGAPAASGYRNFATMFGANNIFDTDYFTSMSTESYLWSCGTGSGTSSSAQGIGTTADFAASNLQNIFTLLFGSQFGNWAFDNNFLRAPLASGQTLASCYVGNPAFSLHHMSMGYTIGDGLILTQNNPNDIYLPAGPSLISTALMGDPTLRMHMVEPPSNLQVFNDASSINLDWNSPSNEMLVGYNIYRSSSVNGTFQKINNNTITDTSFVDTSPLVGDNFYLVKTLKLETSGSGTYYNLSLGILGNTNFSTPVADTIPPTATLSTATNNVTSDFLVDIDFSEKITGLTLSDFNIINGNLSNLIGSDSSYSLTITPINEDTVSIYLLAQSVVDLSGNWNELPSNTLNINYTIPPTAGCTNPTNIAINKPSSQHSTQYGAVASRAVDGNTDGDFWGGNSVTITNWTYETWWEVDLESVADIDEIKIYNRTDCCAEVLNNYYVLVSDQPFNSTDLNTTLNQSGVSSFYQTTQAGTPSVITIDGTGRYVRVQLAGLGFMALAEVEVMGCSNSSGLQNQTISFDPISNKTITDDPFGINATASSGLVVSYSIISGPATINGDTITLTGIPGTVVVQADQNGNNIYDPALSVFQNFEVIDTSGGACTTTSNIALGKTATQSGTQWGAEASRAVDGNTDGDFWAASSTTLTNWVSNAWWEIDLGETSNIETINLWNRTDCCGEILNNYYVFVSDQPFNSTNLNTTLNQNGVANFYQNTQAGTPSIIVINGTGRYVRVQLAGEGLLSLAEVEVIGCNNSSGLLNQTISFDPIPNKTITDDSFGLNATASSGLVVTYSILSGPAVINGNIVTLNGTTGTVVVQADQNGNANYNPAPAVSQIFEVTDPLGGGCSTTSNIALGKTATQSGTQLGAEASRAVDGNTDGNPWGAMSTTITSWVSNAWWEVDLGENSNIETINLWNRTDCCDDIFRNYYVLVSDVPFTSQDLNSSIAQAGVSSFLETGIAGRPTTININRTGQYVRVQLIGTSFLVISEVEVIGCASNNSTILPQDDQEIFFQIRKNDGEAQLSWGCDLNDRTGLFILEKSSDGKHFEFFRKKENNSDISHFIFHREIDEEPLTGDNFYRLKLIQKNGTEVYSKIEKVNFGLNGNQISIFPNPAKNEILINLKQYISKNVTIQIYDARGILMEERYLENLENPHPVFDLKKYENGFHFVAIKAEGKKMVTKKFIIEKGN